MTTELFAAYVRDRFPRPADHPMLASHQKTGLTRIREMIRRWGGAILADEPGMGKSYIAAALAADAAREGVVPHLIVPASLRAQWILCMQRFGFEAPEIVSHEALHRRPPANFDRGSKLILVDEAHRFRNPRTKRYGALCDLARGQPVLLVTATPVCNQLGDLLALLRIFAADDILHQEGVASMTGAFENADRNAVQKILEELVVRRTRESLPSTLAFGPVERRVVPYRIDQSDEIAGQLKRLRFPVMARPSDRHLLRTLMWRRLDSSEAAFRESLRRQRRFYLRALEATGEGCHLSRRDFLRIFGDGGDEAPVQELMFRSFWFPAGRAREDDLRAIDCELSVIDTLLRILDRSEGLKLQALRRICDEIPDERILIFTGAVATASAVYAILRDRRRAGYVSSDRTLVGRHSFSDASYAFESFARGELDLIVATDIASEGLNLESASCVIHYDLPWNPVKLEQRNGRAARIGQIRSNVRAMYFISSSRVGRMRSLGVIAAKARIVRWLFGRGTAEDQAPFLRSQTWLDRALLDARGSDRDTASIRTPRAGGLVHIREITGTVTAERIAATVQGRLVFDWESVERAVMSGQCEGNAMPDLSPAIRYHSLTLLNRAQMPARIPRDRLLFRRQLESLGLWTTRWSELLASSYPHGIECEIRSAAENVTAAGLERLAVTLEGDGKKRASFVRVQVVGRSQ